MPKLPKLPQLPDFDENPIKAAGNIIKDTVGSIQRIAGDIDEAVKGVDFEVRTSPGEPATPIEEIASATVCLQRCRDHWSTISSTLSEGLRFARSDGMASKDVQGRIGLAIDEANKMEKIDLAATAIAGLKGKEKELSEWSLENSRQLRHQIGEIRTLDDMEKAAAEAARLRQEYMTRYGVVRQSYTQECEECEALKDLRTTGGSKLTSEETIDYQKREIAKELWQLEKHLAQGCRIPDKSGKRIPCDCCEKGSWIAGLAYESIPIAERAGQTSGIFEKLASWADALEPMVTVAAVESGQYDYKKLSGQASALRKELMGSLALGALLSPKNRTEIAERATKMLEGKEI